MSEITTFHRDNIINIPDDDRVINIPEDDRVINSPDDRDINIPQPK